MLVNNCRLAQQIEQEGRKEQSSAMGANRSSEARESQCVTGAENAGKQR